MKRAFAAFAVVALLAPQALAQQSKLEQAYAKALDQIAKGKPDDAVKTMTKAASENGAEGQLLLGRLHERLGNLDEAQNAYNAAKAAATGPARADVLAALADFTLRKGTGKDALAAANEALAASPSAKALAAQARALVRNEDGPGALAAADKAVAAGATVAMAHVARGEALTALGRNAEAEQSLKKAVELDPKSALAYSRLARAQVSLPQRATDAVASARKATELDDKFGEGFAILGIALARGKPQELERRDRAGTAGRFPRSREPAGADGGRQDLRGERAVRAGLGRLPQGAADGPRLRARAARSHPDRAQPRQSRGGARRGQEGRGRHADEPRDPDADRRDGAPRAATAAAALAALEKATKGLPGNADGWALLGRAYHYNRALRRGGRGLQEGGLAHAAQHRLQHDARPRARAGGRARGRPRGAPEGDEHARLQGRRRLGQPRLDLPQHEPRRRVDRRLQEGPRARPQAGAGGARPRLGVLVHEEVRRGDQGLRAVDPDRREGGDPGRHDRDRLELLLQARHGAGARLRRQGDRGGTQRRARQGEHRASTRRRWRAARRRPRPTWTRRASSSRPTKRR